MYIKHIKTTCACDQAQKSRAHGNKKAFKKFTTQT